MLGTHRPRYISTKKSSIPTEVVNTKKIIGTRSGEQPSVCSSIGFDVELTSVSKRKESWARHFVDAASFTHPLRGDDLSFLLEGLQIYLGPPYCRWSRGPSVNCFKEFVMDEVVLGRY